MNQLDRRRHDEGATAVEYGLLMAAIAAVVIVIVFALGSAVSEMFDDSCRAVKGGSTGPAAACD